MSPMSCRALLAGLAISVGDAARVLGGSGGTSANTSQGPVAHYSWRLLRDTAVAMRASTTGVRWPLEPLNPTENRHLASHTTTPIRYIQDPPHSANVLERGGIESYAVYGGAQNFILDNLGADDNVMLMVAGNSGHPGGKVSKWTGSTYVAHPTGRGHAGQEEDVVDSWLTVKGADAFAPIARLWGMEAPFQSGRDERFSPRTLQGVDYIHAEDPQLFADAWVLRDGAVCRKVASENRKKISDGKFDAHDRRDNVTLVFVAGPNGDCKSGAATIATFCKKASSDYEFLREGAKQALRAGLDAMILEAKHDPNLVAVVARISTNIYCPKTYRKRMNGAIPNMLTELLNDPIIVGNWISSYHRGQFFKRVILPDLA